MTSAERLATVLFVVFVLLALPALAAPPIFVGNGTPASCTETALGDALVIAATVGGGTIKFHCGGGPVTIELTATLIPPDDTTINGGGLMTLTSNGVFLPLVFVSSNTTVALNDLSIVTPESATNAYAVPYSVLNQGTLTIKKSTFTGRGSIFCCGGIHNQGTLTIDNSLFSAHGNADPDKGGAAILNEGPLTVKNSEFLGNEAAYRGGAIYNVGTLTVSNSTFSGNTALFELGGGIFNIGGTATVANSTFSNGFAGIGGGAIWGGPVSVHNSEFSGNLAFSFGGAVGGASLTVKNSTFSNNRVCCSFVNSDGGAIHGGGIIEGSTFSGNFAYSDGGAIWGGGTIQNSTFSGNFAGQFGGAIFNLGSSIENSTITQNTATVAGGGIYNAGTLSLTRTSVTENTPDDIFP